MQWLRIDAVAVTSYNHEWNKVRLYDSWYNVDCTWDDQSGGFYYNYFLRNDEYYDTCTSIRKTVIRKKATGKIICRYVRWTAVLRGIHREHCQRLQEADNPQIMAVDAGNKYYIQMICGLDGAQIYYNIEGRNRL